jgi:hypothetical protein
MFPIRPLAKIENLSLWTEYGRQDSGGEERKQTPI